MTNPTVGNQLAIICIQSAEIFQRFLLTDSGDTNVKLYVQSTPDNSNLQRNEKKFQVIGSSSYQG